MATVKIERELFKLNELEDKARDYAINEHRNFLILIGEYGFDNDFVIESVERESLINEIVVNGYLFYSNGELAETITYTGNHEKSRTSELTLNGKVYQL